VSLILLICGVISAAFFLSPIKKRAFEDISDPGAQYRIIKAKIAYAKFKKNPILGEGLGSFHYEAQFSNIWAYRAHSTLENNYLRMLAEGGLITFLAFSHSPREKGYFFLEKSQRSISLFRSIGFYNKYHFNAVGWYVRGYPFLSEK
jgi:hypothetical protein